MPAAEPPARFEFGLSSAEEARAARLHRDAVVVDLLSQHAGSNIFDHYDESIRRDLAAAMAAGETAFDRYIEAVHFPYELSRCGRSHLIRDWFMASGLTCGTYGLEVHDGCDPQCLKWERFATRYACLPWIRRVISAAEIRQAKQEGCIASYAHCQPTREVPSNLRAFDAAHAKGLRSFMLTYNKKNSIGTGCTASMDEGLTPFGVEVVQRCNELGMIVDVSHCGRLTTLDACRHSRKPVNANHTAARGLYRHARGKDDDELQAIADTGGVIGIVAVPAFITDAPTPTIHHMLDHIDYVAHRVGWQHVAIGTDWPLQAPIEIQAALLSPQNQILGFRVQDRLDVTRRLVGFDDCRDLPNITRGLVRRGYGDEQIRGILGENALRVFQESWGG
jgi:membrane dipeptidase